MQINVPALVLIKIGVISFLSPDHSIAREQVCERTEMVVVKAGKGNINSVPLCIHFPRICLLRKCCRFCK